MSEQTFTEAVRESRVFYRRRLAERLACAQIRSSGGVDSALAVKRAEEITAALTLIEEAEFTA